VRYGPGASGVFSTFLEDLVEISEIGLTLTRLDRLFKEANLCIRDATVHSAILRPFNQLFGADTPGLESCLISGIALPLNSLPGRWQTIALSD
jgi:hypothetical protein